MGRVLTEPVWPVAAATARHGVAVPVAKSFYRPELDGIRFFAFLAVYVNHTMLFGAQGHHQHLPDWLGNALGTIGIAGAFGVDLFFVLSAYLITELLLREQAVRGAVDVTAFYLRRVLRIWPLYISVLALAMALTWVVPTEKFTWLHWIGFMLFSGNWVYMLQPVTTIAAPLWSISVEEQFYLAWPWVVQRAAPRRIAALAVGVIVIGMAARLVMGSWHLSGDLVTKNSLTRIDGIAAGVLLAVALRGRMPQLSGWTRAGLLACSAAVWWWVAGSFGLFDNTVALPALILGWPMVALAGAGMLLGVLGGKGPVAKILGSAPLAYLGRISYGLYVFHQLGLLLAARAFPQHEASVSQWLGHWILGLILTMAMAAASYRWLESPFLRMKRQRYTVVHSGAEGV
jgi:peptidoglycan/LPS O-acetylase OafA/YrhL